MNNTKTTLIPTQLFVGSQEILEEKTEEFLQQVFCKNNSAPSPVRPPDFAKASTGMEEEHSDVSKPVPSSVEGDCYCNNCRKIKNQQHESIIFIDPEKDYTLKDIEIIFEKINFALDDDQHFFFILQKAQTLNLACANKLLKVLEEPPAGYNFILHTNNTNSILPTILSRCHITNFSSADDTAQIDHPLLSFFYKQDFNNPAEFEKELRKQALTDSQSIELANNFMIFFAKRIIDHYKKETNTTPTVHPEEERSRACPELCRRVSKDRPEQGAEVLTKAAQSNGSSEIKNLQNSYEYLKKIMIKPPQSGSSNLFWKNLYLTFPRK